MVGISLYKDKYSYGSNFKFKMTPKYDSKDYDDMYCKFEFERYMDKFDLDEIKELSDYNLKYNIIWTNKEACQQCCDYLNNQKD